MAQRCWLPLAENHFQIFGQEKASRKTLNVLKLIVSIILSLQLTPRSNSTFGSTSMYQLRKKWIGLAEAHKSNLECRFLIDGETDRQTENLLMVLNTEVCRFATFANFCKGICVSFLFDVPCHYFKSSITLMRFPGDMFSLWSFERFSPASHWASTLLCPF